MGKFFQHRFYKLNRNLQLAINLQSSLNNNFYYMPSMSTMVKTSSIIPHFKILSKLVLARIEGLNIKRIYLPLT